MATILLHKHIAAPPAATWDTLCDIARHPSYMRHVEHVDIPEEGPLEPGFRWLAWHRTPGRPTPVQLQIIALRKETFVSVESLGRDYAATFDIDLAGATRSGVHGTNVTLRVEPRPVPGAMIQQLARMLLAGLRQRRVRAELSATLDDLATETERRER